jgi:hypothetical protein
MIPMEFSATPLTAHAATAQVLKTPQNRQPIPACFMISLAMWRLGILWETVWFRMPFVHISWLPFPPRKKL